MKLTPKLTLTFIFFAAALVGAVNLLGYSVGRSSLENAAIAELQSTAGEKQVALAGWIDQKQADIRALADDPSTIEQAASLRTSPLHSLGAAAIHNRLIEEFEPRILSHEFLTLMLLDPQTGKVLVATDPKDEGQSRLGSPYFSEGKIATYLPPIYFSQELQSPAMTVVSPVRSKDGHLQGVLAGMLNLKELDAIIQRDSGIRKTTDAFLVNTSHQFVTRPRFLPDSTVLQQSVYTVPVNRCLEHKSGSVIANDYRNVLVIAVYRWLPQHDMCLIVKIDQAEAFTPQHSFGINISLIGLAAVLIASLVAVGLSHTLIAPIRAMQTAAQRYGQGDLAIRLPETRRDELGSLASEFNTMAATLEEKEKQLRLHSLELEQRVAERTAEFQQSEERYRSLFENMLSGYAYCQMIFRGDHPQDFIYLEVNRAFEALTGLKNVEGKKASEVIPGVRESNPELFEVYGRVALSGQPERLETYLKSLNIWFWISVYSPRQNYFIAIFDNITERKLAEGALRESEEKFKYIFDHSLIGKSITRVDGTLTVNKAFCDMLGYSQDELVNQKWQEITHPDDIDLSNQLVDLLLAGEKESVRFTKRYLHKKGSTVWADVSISLRRDPEGKPLYFMTALLDITERKQTEMQLADTLEFNEHILTSAPIGIFTYQLSGQCLSANAAAAQMVGATVEQLKSQNFRELESWKQSGLYDLAEQAIASRQLIAADVHHITTFSKNAWYRAQFVTFHSAGEELLLMIFNDITERKQAESALHDSEARYRTLMERSLEAIYMYELDSKRVVVANPAFLDLLGYTADEVNHLTLYDIVGNDRRSVDQYLEQVLEQGGISMGERLWRRKDGTTCPVEVTANKIQQGEKDLIFVVGRDITERKHAEEVLREKERLLTETQHIGQIGSFSYDITKNTLQFSDEMYHLLDILPEKFQHNRDVLALIYPSDRPLAAKWLEDIRAGRQIKGLDFRIFRQNGELRYLRCKGAVEFSSEGKPTRFIGTMQDVTDHRLAEIQIDRQLKHLTALSEIDRAVISGSDQHYTLGVILSQTLSQLQVDAAGILLLDADGQTLSYAAEQGFQSQVDQIQVRIGESHAGRVARERRLIRIPSLPEQTNDPLFNMLVAKEKFVSYVGVPLIVKKEVKGVLEVFHRTLFQPYQEWLDFLNALAGQTAIALENATLLGNLQTSNRELARAYDATLEGWSHAMDLRDKETEGHTQRVTELTMKVARAMGMNESQLLHIRRGALLHDIGKLGIPDQILFKPENLTPEEWETMQKHPEYAYEMLSPIQYLKPALPIPYFHHEKWDGSGYPLGLRGEHIPLEARIFAVVDVWDALLSDRPYRKAWTVERTLEHIRTLAGSHFDPVVVDCFMKIMQS